MGAPSWSANAPAVSDLARRHHGRGADVLSRRRRAVVANGRANDLVLLRGRRRRRRRGSRCVVCTGASRRGRWWTAGDRDDRGGRRRPSGVDAGIGRTVGAGVRQPAAWSGGRGDGAQVHRPDHWLLAGTGLRRGDQLGAAVGVVGYECDGCALTMVDGLPTGPAGFDVVAIRPGHAVRRAHDAAAAGARRPLRARVPRRAARRRPGVAAPRPRRASAAARASAAPAPSSPSAAPTGPTASPTPPSSA